MRACSIFRPPYSVADDENIHVNAEGGPRSFMFCLEDDQEMHGKGNMRESDFDRQVKNQSGNTPPRRTRIIEEQEGNFWHGGQVWHDGPSVDLFAGFSEQPPASSFVGKSPELPVPKNEGWAMFDTPQHAASGPVTENLSLAVTPSDGDLSVKFDQLQSLNTTVQWPLFENSSALSLVMSSQWQEGSHEGQSSAAANSTQSWNAFNDSAESLSSEPQVVAYNHSATTNLHLGLDISESLDNDGFQTASLQAGFAAASPSNGDSIAPQYAPMMNPLLGEKQSHAAGHKSTNPFDLPYDSEVEQSDMFLDMSSLQTALPNAQLSSTFLGGLSQPWFPQNPMTPYIAGTPQGGLAYMSGQAPSSQLSNVPTQGPVASIGGNPFA